MEELHQKNIKFTRILFVVWLFLLVANIANKEQINNIYAFVFFGLVAFSVSFLLNKLKKGTKFVMYFLQSSIVGLISLLLWFDSSMDVYIYLYAAITVPLFYNDKQFLGFATFASSLSGSVFFFLKREDLFPKSDPSDFVYILFSFLVLGLLMHRAVKSIEKTHHLLLDSYRESERNLAELEVTLQTMHSQADAVRSFSGELNKHVTFTADHFNQITSSFQEMQQAISQQNQSLIENTLDMDRIANGSGTVAEGSRRMNDQISKSNEIIERSSKQMDELEKHTLQMDRLFSETENVTKELHNKLHDIKGMSELIEKIAQQTGLLSLNASITAEKAGNENGRAFAVIADEVHVLASSAEEAAATIQAQIRSIASISDTTLTKMRASRQSVDKTMENSQIVKESLEEVKKQSREIVKEIRQIQHETEALRSSLGNMNEQSSNLSAISEENSAQLEGIEQNLLQLQKSMRRIEEDFDRLQSQLN